MLYSSINPFGLNRIYIFAPPKRQLSWRNRSVEIRIIQPKYLILKRMKSRWGGWEAETNGLLNRRTSKVVPRVRIPPSPLITFRDVAQPGSAPVLGTGGPRFESWYPDIKGHPQGWPFLFLVMEFYTYILQSESSGSLYIGSTNNLDDRLSRHNNNLNTYTKGKGPWLLLYYSTFSTRSEAVQLERFLKRKKSKSRVLAWIASQPR